MDFTDPSGATVDCDGDGRLDSEDSATENYTQAKEGSTAKKRAYAKMIAAHRDVAAKYAAAAAVRRAAAWEAFFGKWLPTGATRVAPGSTVNLGQSGTSIGVPWLWSGSYAGLESPELLTEAHVRIVEREEAHYTNSAVYFKPYSWQAWHPDGQKRWVQDHGEYGYETGLVGYGCDGYGEPRYHWIDLTMWSGWRDGDAEW